MARSRHLARTPALCLLASLLLLTACATRHPLGMDEAQWQALSTEQRLACWRRSNTDQVFRLNSDQG